MKDFLIISLVFGVLAWLADSYIPKIGRIVAIVIVVVWVLRYLVPLIATA